MTYKFLQFSIIFVMFSFFIGVGFSELSFGDDGIDSPRKQLEKGIDSKDIICKPGYVLVILQS
ncbi:MAG: hypothetical protein ACPGQP_01795, partial [Nitrosopumilus sp.]